MNQHKHEHTALDDENESQSVHPLLRKEKPKHKPEDVFKDAVGFYEDDLKANQAGQISKEQYRILYTRRNMWLVGIFMSASVFIILWFGFRAAFLIALVAGGLFYSCNKWLILNKDLKSRQVANVEGRISLDVNGRKYTLTIENIQFALKKNAFLAFKNGDPYRIFYTPYSKQLLSAEWLRD